jgi:AAA domain
VTDIGDVLSRLKRERIGREHIEREDYHGDHEGRDDIPEAEDACECNGRGESEQHARKGNGPDGERRRLIESSAEFVADFTPPDYVLDGVLQRRFCYSFTGKTGAGKTAILLRLSAHVALGQLLGDREVEQGRVSYFAGENPTDVRMRWIALAQQIDFDINTIDVHFIPGTFKISELRKRIQAEAERVGDFALVIIDTSAAYFEGDDENNAKQAGAHARLLRGLTELPGGPCVLVACHPPKNAGDDNLQPRGSGGLIAEMDGNLTATKHDGTVEMHWQGKFRGPDFPPLSFLLRTVTHERLKDTKGRPIPTVIAADPSDAAKDEMATAARSQADQLLALLVDHGSESLNELAKLLQWAMKNGKPYRMLVSRTIDALVKDKLIKKDGRGYVVTDAGHKALRNGGRK